MSPTQARRRDTFADCTLSLAPLSRQARALIKEQARPNPQDTFVRVKGYWAALCPLGNGRLSSFAGGSTLRCPHDCGKPRTRANFASFSRECRRS